MKASSKVDIIDATDDHKFERFLYRCIFHSKYDTPTNAPYSRHRDRRKYLESAIPKGFHMKIMFYEGDHIGMIEYAPAEASGLPIVGDNVIVMNCVWVHKKAHGHNFGKRLLREMIESEKQAAGFATLALEDYWMVWMKKDDIERLGFRSIESTESTRLRHKTYHHDRLFKMHLMWLPATENARTPIWDESKLLEGVSFCPYHPIYRERYGVTKLKLKEIYEKC